METVREVGDDAANNRRSVVDVQERLGDVLDVQQRREFGEGDADDVADFLDVNRVVEQIGLLDKELGAVVVRQVLQLRLDEQQLAEDQPEPAGAIAAFELEREAVLEVVYEDAVVLTVAHFLPQLLLFLDVDFQGVEVDRQQGDDGVDELDSGY